MMNREIARLMGAATGITIVVFALVIFFGARFMPQCQEDQVLMGVGKFRYGYWDSYECGPAADDFAPFSDIQLQACGEAWYHTLAALDEALIRLDR